MSDAAYPYDKRDDLIMATSKPLGPNTHNHLTRPVFRRAFETVENQQIPTRFIGRRREPRVIMRRGRTRGWIHPIIRKCAEYPIATPNEIRRSQEVGSHRVDSDRLGSGPSRKQERGEIRSHSREPLTQRHWKSGAHDEPRGLQTRHPLDLLPSRSPPGVQQNRH